MHPQAEDRSPAEERLVTNQLRIHPEAQAELEAAERFYARREPTTGRRFLAEALTLLERVHQAPRQFPEHGLVAVPTAARPLFFAVRRAVMPGRFPYVLFYFLREGSPVVLAFAHTRRRPGYWTHRV
jgi:toxin ParE1/3/4